MMDEKGILGILLAPSPGLSSGWGQALSDRLLQNVPKKLKITRPGVNKVKPKVGFKSSLLDWLLTKEQCF